MQENIYIQEQQHPNNPDQKKINEFLVNFLSGNKIEIRKNGLRLKICWFGGKYNLNYPINDQAKRRMFS